ncbi:PREDICTED: uncharacterized protein C20orf96 homolog [Thamnophis sirtalis]|uniref:Uncharacterized protein C20orf96 homolog n=1 Tax=Thamnophis sirtalis TaxID=35019 RepID=A0A6I9XTT9_9SAUR|nr:PREDICTED: uncharacterized protein C20orf96 homolog [Thamnophis sirtalis]
MKKEEKESLQKSQSKIQEERRVRSLALKASPSMRHKVGWHQALTEEMTKANVKILQRLSKSKMASLEELKRHSLVLLEKNTDLMETIQEAEANSAYQARTLLQQYDMFGRIIATLRDSNQNQIGAAKADLSAAEKRVEKKMAKLNQELTRVDTRVHTMQEEVNVLRSYMDKEYPLKAVQIASLLRTIRNLNEEQQDELEDTEDLARRFLDTLTKKARDEQERILHSVADKKLLQYQDGLEQMHRNNTELRRQIDVQKERLSKSKMASLEELKRHSLVLLEKNTDLMETIQEAEANSAYQARTLLQQYDMFGKDWASLVTKPKNFTSSDRN